MENIRIPLMSLYNYDNSIFDGLSLPYGINKETLIDKIMIRGGEYESIYTSVPFLKSAITNWSDTHRHLIERWLYVFNKEFEPLENYDRVEDWTDDANNSTTGTGTTKGNDNTHAQGNVTGTNTVSAYNTNNLVNDNGTSQGNTTDTTSSTQTNSTTESNDTTHSMHSGRVHGNIGVTTSMQMYESFWTLMGEYGDIYNAIATLFLQDFVVPIL